MLTITRHLPDLQSKQRVTDMDEPPCDGGALADPADDHFVLQATRSVPIVFVFVADPVGAGFVDSLTRPGGNATGFLQFEYGLSGKWLEVLKQIAPDLRRVAVIRDPAITAGIGQFGAIQAVAPSLGLDVSPLNVRDAGEIERTPASFAGSSLTESVSRG
jgi:putative ABC transport system substrate-binding protein